MKTLAELLGAYYHATYMGHGHKHLVVQALKEEMSRRPVLEAQARVELQRLTEIEQHVGAAEFPARDVIQATHLYALRAALQ